MTGEDKKLLLKDLSARLPYFNKVQIKNEIVVLDSICDDDGYEFQDKEGNVINTDVIKLVKKQPQYPTYEECCNELERPEILISGYVLGYKGFLLSSLQKLLVCRDAYWKIAGEQMGLGKPWEPDWLNTAQDKFVLYTHDNLICLNRFVLGHNVLAFPTAEIRDAFLDNFKELINKTKELL